MSLLHFLRRAEHRLYPQSKARALAALAGLSLSVACGSSAGTAGNAGVGGSGSSGSGGAAEHAAGGSSANGGAVEHGGSAGANGGAAGHSAGAGGATGGASGAAGSGGAGGGGSAAGGSAGAAQEPACPATPPAAASSCPRSGQSCFYEDCAGNGRSAATCNSGAWAVQTGACGVAQCIGFPASMSCPSGQLCAVSEGGTISALCVQSTCDKGPITCECAHASCSDCSIAGSVQQGFTVTCNSCPQGGCA